MSVYPERLSRKEPWILRGERRLGSLPNKMPKVAYSIDASNSEFLYINKVAEKVYGRSVREFYRNPDLWLEVIHPEERDRVRQVVTTLLPKRHHCKIQYHVIRPDGEIRYLRDHKKLLRDKNGNPLRIDGVITEITVPTYRQQRKMALMSLVGKQEPHFQKLAANLPGIIYQYIVRSDGSEQFTYISPGCCSIYELEPEAIQQDATLFWNLVHPDDRQGLRQSLAVAAQTFGPWKWEWRIITASGAVKWLSGVAQLQKQSNGEGIWQGLILDISDSARESSASRKMTEIALRTAEENLNNTVRQLQQAQRIAHIGSWEFDVLTQTVTWSDEMLRILGIDPVAKPLLSFADHLQYIYPDDLELWLNTIERALAEGKSYEIDYRINRHDGELRYVNGRGEVLLSEYGHVLRLFVTTLDITERKQAELALQLSEAQLRELAQQAQAKSAELEQAIRNLQQTQASLIQAEKMSSLGQMIAGVAHEINNPVSFIYGNVTPAQTYISDLLELVKLYRETYPELHPKIVKKIDEIELDFLVQDLQKLLNSMQLGAERIREIVNSLRVFSRLDESEMKEVNLHESIDSTLMILHHRLKAKPEQPAIHLVKEYGNLPAIKCYAGQLNQVFMNLLANAIDAIEERNSKLTVEERKVISGEIRIKTALLPSNRVQISICDNGSGMDREVVTKIFDPFYTTKPIGKGTGLGLSISYQIIVDKHQGVLRCLSERGQGSEFIIEIPQQ